MEREIRSKKAKNSFIQLLLLRSFRSSICMKGAKTSENKQTLHGNWCVLKFYTHTMDSLGKRTNDSLSFLFGYSLFQFFFSKETHFKEPRNAYSKEFLYLLLANLWTVPFEEVYSLVLPLVSQNDNQKFLIKNLKKLWRNPNRNN